MFKLERAEGILLKLKEKKDSNINIGTCIGIKMYIPTENVNNNL